MFFIRFRWSSVDGRKRCKNASVDEKLFIRFQETENGGFRKRISVDRASEYNYYGSQVYVPAVSVGPSTVQFVHPCANRPNTHPYANRPSTCSSCGADQIESSQDKDSRADESGKSREL